MTAVQCAASWGRGDGGYAAASCFLPYLDASDGERPEPKPEPKPEGDLDS